MFQARADLCVVGATHRWNSKQRSISGTKIIFLCHFRFVPFCTDTTFYFLLSFKIRVVPDTDLAGYMAAGYPANNFAGYWISGRISGLAGYRKYGRISGYIVNKENFFNFIFKTFSFQIKFINIYDRNFNLILYSLKMFWNKFALSKFASFVQQFNRISVQPDIPYNPSQDG